MFCREALESKKWTEQEWLNFLEEGSNKRRLQYCLDSYADHLCMRAIQGHSGGTKLFLSLQDKLEIPFNWSENIYHVGSSLDAHSMVHSGLIGRGNGYERRKTCSILHNRESYDPSSRDESYDVMKPRKVPYRTKSKVLQNTVFGST